jgi:hypothetical protein
MSDTAPLQIAHKVDKERISEVIGRLRGTGGLPLTPDYVKSLIAWLHNLSKRGYLGVDFLRDKEAVHHSFMTSFPNSNTRSQFSRAILSYFSGLTDDEFEAEYPGLTRIQAVDAVRAVAAKATKDINESKSRKRT